MKQLKSIENIFSRRLLLKNMKASSTVLSAYSSILNQPFHEIRDKIGTDQLPLPSFKKKLIIDLCHEVSQILKNEPILLDLSFDGPVVVVGDLHGSFLDFLRILRYFDYRKNIFLFLGDFVDRGQFSLEILTLLFALKVNYHNQYYFIRGNHEFEQICSFYGFLNELQNKKLINDASDELYVQLMNVFSWLPLACVLNKSVFCVHGGLSPYLKNLNSFAKIQRPLQTYASIPLIEDIVWADVTTKSSNSFIPNSRGSGISFSDVQVEGFLKANNLSAIVRGHQFIKGGVEYLFDKKFITVFSASNYKVDSKRKEKKLESNKSGTLVIESNGLIKDVIFDPIERLDVNKVIYKEYNKVENEKGKNFASLKCLKVSRMGSTTLINSPRRVRPVKSSSDVRICNYRFEQPVLVDCIPNNL